MFKSLQMGRAVAALGVLAFHLSLAFGDPRYGDARLWLDFTRYGWHGVDFFFALSGFIILYAHQADIGVPSRLGRYSFKRAIRIYPLYWVLTSAVILVSVSAGRSIPMTASEWASALSLVRFTAGHTPLLPAWTLFHEVFFYIVFALLIWHRWIGCLAVGVWLVLIMFMGPNAASDRSFWSVAVSPLNLCFFGGMAACLAHRSLTAARSLHFVIVGFFLLVFSVALGVPTLSLITYSVLIGMAFFLLIAGTVGLERNGRFTEIPWLSIIGSASYVLYLTHIVVMTGILKLAYLTGLVRLLGFPVLYILVFVLTTACAVLIHLRIEKPMQRFFASRFTSRKPSIQAFGVSP
jgi:exopolysaccharide production protein ExoZ